LHDETDVRRTEATMRFQTKRQKDRGRPSTPRIAFSQEEITADLNYRAGTPRRAGSVTPIGRGRR
jgi:hypothetical protein